VLKSLTWQAKRRPLRSHPKATAKAARPARKRVTFPPIAMRLRWMGHPVLYWSGWKEQATAKTGNGKNRSRFLRNDKQEGQRQLQRQLQRQRQRQGQLQQQQRNAGFFAALRMTGQKQLRLYWLVFLQLQWPVSSASMASFVGFNG
jgi:hypothetical protein